MYLLRAGFIISFIIKKLISWLYSSCSFSFPVMVPCPHSKLQHCSLSQGLSWQDFVEVCGHTWWCSDHIFLTAALQPALLFKCPLDRMMISQAAKQALWLALRTKQILSHTSEGYRKFC